ncbi:MAG: Crp/Fnr family transcriptional regulator [Ardenticatenaceae bacterium]
MDFSSFFNYPTGEVSPVSSQDLVFLPNRSRRDWGKLLAHTETLRFNKGDFVVRQADMERVFYLVTFGQFEELLPQGRGQRSRRMAIIDQGSLIGVQTFLDGQGHPTDVRALVEGEVVRLSFEAYEVLSAREPELARAILLDLGRILSLRLRQQMSESK